MKKYVIGLVAIYSLAFLSPPVVFAQDSARQEGIRAYDQGSYAKAVPLLQAAVQQAPQDHALRVKYAYSLLMVKKYPQARQEFEYIISHSPNPKLVAYAQRALQTIPSAHQPATPVVQSGHSPAVTQVQEMLRNLQKQEKLADLAPYFTNESAAALGLAFVMFSGFIMAMSGEEGPPMEQQLKAVLQRYNLSPGQDPATLGQQEMEQLNRQGRQFFKEVSMVMDRLAIVKSQIQDSRQAIAHINIKDISFREISPTKVEFRHVADKQTIEAILEEGQWRLHLGDLQELMQKGGQFSQLSQ